GICGLSLPCGLAQVPGENGGAPRELPIGLQLLGPAFEEAKLFQIAHAYEQSTDWHKQRAPI
ncbi:MAG: hypothetical protein ACYT04_000000101660, partial [Nostoc sp.]